MSNQISSISDEIESQSSTSIFLQDYVPVRKKREELQQLANKIKSSTFEQITLIGKEENSKDFNQEVILEETSASELNSTGNILSNIVKVCKHDVRQKRGFFAKIIGAAEEKIGDIKRQYSTVQQHLNTLSEELQKEKQRVSRDRHLAEVRMKEIFDAYYIASDFLEAFQIAKLELEQDFNITAADEMQALLLSEGKAFHLELLDQKIAELAIRKTALHQQQLQGIRQVANLKRVELSFSAMAETAISLWQNGIAMFVQSLRTKHSVGIINAVQQATDQLWIANSKEIAENSKEIFDITSKTILSIDAIEKVQDIIHKNIEEIQKKYEATCQERKQTYIRLEQMDKVSNKSKIQIPSF